MHSSVQIFLYPLLFVRNGEPDKRKLKMLQMTTIKRFVQIFLNTFTSCLLQLLFTGIVIQGSIILTFKAKCNTQINFGRTRSIRWKWVCWNFLQVVGVLFYLYFIFVRFCVPVRNVKIFFYLYSFKKFVFYCLQVFRQIGHEPMSGKALVLAVFGCMLPGTLVLLCGFFCLLHAWLNAFAEMLRFADRMFYQVLYLNGVVIIKS